MDLKFYEILWFFSLLGLILFFYVRYVSVWVYATGMDLWRPGKGFRSAGAGVTGGCELWVCVLGTEFRSFRKAASWCSYQWAIFPAPNVCNSYRVHTIKKLSLIDFLAYFWDLFTIVSHFTFKGSIALEFGCSVFWGVRKMYGVNIVVIALSCQASLSVPIPPTSCFRYLVRGCW